MLDKKNFSKIRENLERYDKQREELIKKARDVLRLSKRLIYSLHRQDEGETAKLLKEVKREKQKLDRIAYGDKKLFSEGSYSHAMQEYAEALCYYGFNKKRKIPNVAELKMSQEDYLMGICDLTGELARKAVTVAHKNKKEVEEIKNFIENVYGEFIKFNLRNSELRKKSDSIKWNLKKLEELSYDINK